MNCRELTEFLMDYLDGELPGAEKQRFDGHLGECPSCIDYLHSYGETVRLGRLCAESDEPPPEMPEELVTAILAARRK